MDEILGRRKKRAGFKLRQKTLYSMVKPENFQHAPALHTQTQVFLLQMDQDKRYEISRIFLLLSLIFSELNTTAAAYTLVLCRRQYKIPLL